MANLNTIVSGDSAVSPTIQTYYDKKLLRNMKLSLVYNQFAQKRNIPARNGKTVQFRKMTPFAPVTTALVEGVTPDGGSIEITDITATVSQYGDYRTVSDVLDLIAIDPIINEIIDMHADQAALTVDNLARDCLTESADATNVLYAAGTQRSAIAKTDVLTSTLLRKAVRAMKKAKAQKIDGYYIAIVGPDTTFDLQADDNWLKVSQYQDKSNIYTGEIGSIFGVRIVETTESKIFEADEHILAAGTNITETDTLTTVAADAYILATPSIQVTATAATLGSSGIAALINKYVVIAGQRRKIANAAAHATPANGTILTLDAALTGVADKASALNGITIYPQGGGITGNPIAATVILGKNAYGDIDIEGSKNVRTYVIKPGGQGDPLHQRNIIGWKIMAYVCKILMPEWVLRIEHGISE